MKKGHSGPMCCGAAWGDACRWVAAAGGTQAWVYAVCAGGPHRPTI